MVFLFKIGGKVLLDFLKYNSEIDIGGVLFMRHGQLDGLAKILK